MRIPSAAKIIKRFIFLLIPLLCVLSSVSGCTKSETPKKVSLSNRSGEASQKADHRQGTLWFGFDLRLGPKEEVKIYSPFLKYLEKTTGHRFRIKFTEKYSDTVENLGKGATHFAALGTLSYVIGKNKYNIKYLASGVNREGDPKYRAVIITRPQSPLNKTSELRGKCFAFGSEMSTQGHLIPRKMLEDSGITLADLREYMYTGSHINAVKAVLNGECDAGGIQDVLAKRLASEGKVKILQVSDPYPSSIIACNGSLDSGVADAVRSALLSFEPRGKHKHMLVDWDKTEMPFGFTSIEESEIDKLAVLAKEYGLLKE